MSGRDLRSFLEKHRSGTFHVPSRNVSGELTLKYVSGASGGRHKSVDYEELLNKAKSHKRVANSQLGRMEKLAKQNKKRKEADLLSLHREVWNREMLKLQQERRKIETELEYWRTGNHHDDVGGVAGGLWVELSECEMEIVSERRHFDRQCIHPVKVLLGKLRTWRNARDKVESDQEVGVASEAGLRVELCRVREDLRCSGKELEDGRVSLCEEVTAIAELMEEKSRQEEGTSWKWVEFGGMEAKERGKCETMEEEEEELVATVMDGGSVPEALLQCSSEDLCASLTGELAALDVHFRDRLRQTRDKYCPDISMSYGGDWSRDEGYKFQVVMDQYPGAMKGHTSRELYLDRLTREFPQYNRQQLVEHEKWVWSSRAYHKQYRAVLRDWKSQRSGLNSRISHAVQEYERERIAKEAELCCHEQQRQLCKLLHKKVLEWREEKLLQSELEAQHNATLMAQQQHTLTLEEEHKRKRQARTRARIHSYKEQKEAEVERDLAAQRKLKEVAEGERECRAELERERVEHRKQLLLERLARQRERKEVREEEERERARQLDRLRQQVAIEADSDPDRLLQHTRTTRARLEPSQATPTSFLPLHSYTSHQVTSDPRVKLETALRDAGLLQNEYAQYMLSRAPPPSNPRPDQQSSIFKK